MKGLSQTLKDLALTNQTDFSRFLWSASLVSRVEFDEGCLISPPLEVPEPGEGPTLFSNQTETRMAEKNFLETSAPSS